MCISYASYDGLMLFIASPRRVLDAVMLSWAEQNRTELSPNIVFYYISEIFITGV